MHLLNHIAKNVALLNSQLPGFLNARIHEENQALWLVGEVVRPPNAL